MVLAHNRHFRATAVAVLTGLLLGATSCVSSFVADAGAHAHASSEKAHKLSKKQRARLRKTLARQVRHNPALVLNRDFIRKAALVEFRLPLSVRLRRSDGQGGYEPSDDQLEIDWDDSAFQWPMTDGMVPPPQTVFLSGGFTAESIFNGGDTTGYGELGAIETSFGTGIAMTSDPFTISEFSPSCADGPQLRADPDARVTISSAAPRFGVLNPFSQEVRGTLSLRMAFAAGRASSCGATPTPTQIVDNSSAPPMPVRFDGKFTISPSLTPDGKMRFGKITIDDAVTPQLSTFAFVRSCTATPCDPREFPARLKLKKLTAEVLLGDVLP